MFIRINRNHGRHYTHCRFLKRFQSGNVGSCVEKNDLSISKSGEILYHGAALMRGYFRDAKATQDAIIDGFFHTHDLGKLDRHKNLYVTGRLKELIVFSDGKKAMPSQIEKHYQSIAGIKEFAVFGAMDHDIPIAVLAFVPAEKSNFALTLQKILEASSRLKSPFRVARAITVSEIPRSNTLKIKRHVLEKIFYAQHKAPIKSDHHNESDLTKKLIACFQTVLHKKKLSVTAQVTFAELHIDSLQSVQICDAINQQLHLKCKPTIFWFYHSIAELAHSLTVENKSMTEKPSLTLRKFFKQNCHRCDGGCFPGATSASAFWKNLLNGKDSIIETPLSRWNNADFYDEYALAPGKTNSKWGGFIDLPNDFFA